MYSTHEYAAVQELQRRCDTLIRLVEKENEDLEVETADKKKGAGSKKSGGAAASKGADSSGQPSAGGTTKVCMSHATDWNVGDVTATRSASKQQQSEGTGNC